MPVQAACFAAAAERYGVPEALLRAVAKVESGSQDARTVENTNRDGTRDIGRMQINSRWLPTLQQWGITEARLRDECTSIHVGAWILAGNIERLGGLNWAAVGSYNVGCRSLGKAECETRRNRYAWKVFHALKPETTAKGRGPEIQVEVSETATRRQTEITAVVFE